MEYYRGKVCIVTGGASGIGFAIGEALLGAGAGAIVLADRDAKTLGSAIEELGDRSERVQSAVVDVTDLAQVESLIQGAAARHGSLDLVFNNAGVGATMPTAAATLEQWRRLIDLNLWGVIYGIHTALPIMRRQGSGHIVTTSSLAGLVPLPYQALYCATKYAVAGLSEALRFEFEAETIHFSVVCPGAVVSRIWGTPIIGERFEAKPPPDAMPAAEAAQTILAGVAKKEGIIVLPESARAAWRRYWTSPEAMEGELRDLARQRRASYESKGTFY